jgi:hypothetical protein
MGVKVTLLYQSSYSFILSLQNVDFGYQTGYVVDQTGRLNCGLLLSVELR